MLAAKSSRPEAGVGARWSRWSRWAPHAALVVVQVAFASQAVEGKIAMSPREAGGEAIPAVSIAMVRMAAAAIVFQAISLAIGGSRPAWRGPRPTARDHLALAGLSLVGIVLNQTLFLLGLHRTSPVGAALLCVTIPVFTAALAIVFRQEAPSARVAAGLLVSVSGVLWLTGVRDVDRGALLVTLNSLCYAFYLVLARPVLLRLGTFTVVTWVFTWGAIVFAPLGVWSFATSLPSITPRGWGYLAYIVLMPTIVAYLFNAWALARTPPSVVTVYIYLQPTIAAVLAWVQLGQVPSARLLVAAALIVAGVVMVARARAAVAESITGRSRRAGAPAG